MIDTDSPQTTSEQNSIQSAAGDSKQAQKLRLWRLSRWLLVILLVGGGITWWQGRQSEPVSQENASEPPPRPVETIALALSDGERIVKLLGQVEAGESATLSPQIDGVVEQVFVREGDRVTPGTTVAVLDDAEPRLAFAEARARLAQERSNLARLQVGTRPEIIAQRRAELNAAQARELESKDNLERIASLSKEGALSQRALVEAKAAADTATSERFRIQAFLAEAQAGPTQEEIEAQQGLVDAVQAAVEQAELQMARTEIQAPFTGIVQSRDVDSGDYVEVNEPIVTLVSDRSLDIFLEVPETLSGQVAPGMTVILTARALPNWQQEKEITAVVPTADTASRRQLVRVSLDNPPPRLLPGMAIGADLAIPVDDKAFIVPRDALTRRGDQWLVFAVNEGKAEQIAVEMVVDRGEEVAIASPDLQPGQEIVLRGGDGLQHNTPVRVEL